MAEEEVVAAGTSPVLSDHKRKFEDLEPETPNPSGQQPLESNANTNSEPNDCEKIDAAVSDEPEEKRARLDALANENDYQDGQVGEPINEEQERYFLENVLLQDGQPTSKEHPEAAADEQTSSKIPELVDAKELPVDGSECKKTEEPSKETEKRSVESTLPDDPSGEKQCQSVDIAVHNVESLDSKQDASFGLKQPTSAAEIMTRKIEVPNNQVGVVIGKAGDTIRYLQYNSGAKIQITRDADADPHSTRRPVELIGCLDSLDKAEKLINLVIAEAEAGGSPSLVARGLSPGQAVAGSEQIQIQVPNEKVGLIIGRGGETIRGLQTKSGARIQLIPQHLPEGVDSKERTVQVTGDKRQIEIAQELIKEVMNQPVRPSTGGFNQQAYRPSRGSGGPYQWSQRAPHFARPTAYDYQHRGQYPSHNPQYPPTPYGNYPERLAPRSSFGSGWEQRPYPSMQGPPLHSGSYEYYGGQGYLSDAPPSTQPPHAAGPPLPSMGPPPAQANYNYGQPQGPDYGHQVPYSQVGHPQQGYGHVYDESKFENYGSNQHPYGGQVYSQPTYPQAGAQPNFVAQQQYGKPPLYGMPSQGQPPQSYGPSRATQPGDIPYQGSTATQSCNSNMQSQQPYPYVSSGPSQAYPSYGSTPAADSYNHPPPASGPYAQPGGQLGYGQPGVQQAPNYGQVVPTGFYGSYPSSQQAYSEQPASSNASYGYQGTQDSSYASTPAPASYSAAPSGQLSYVQPAQTQTGYDQPNPQSVGNGAVQGSAAAACGKTLSPQPAYPQYDTTQVYGAPR